MLNAIRNIFESRVRMDIYDATLYFCGFLFLGLFFGMMIGFHLWMGNELVEKIK